METVKFADLEATVLEPEELKQATELLRQIYRPRADALHHTPITLPGRTIPGNDFLVLASMYNEQIHQLPRQNIANNNSAYEERVNLLIEADPEFSELYFINGRNLIEGTDQLEKYIKEGILPPDQKAQLTENVLETLPRARGYIRKAMNLFDGVIEQHPQLKFYENEMRHYLGCSYRRETALRSKTQVVPEEIDSIKRIIIQKGDPQEHPAWEKYTNIGILTLKAVREFKTSFEKGVFRSKESAAKDLANLANTMKVFSTRRAINQALEYYHLAKQVLGNVPEIEEGIRICKNLVPTDQDFFRFISLN